MKVAIIGGEGFIGKALQRIFDKKEIAYFVFDSLYPRVHKDISITRSNFLKADFRYPAVTEAIDFTLFDEIYFLIAETSTGDSLREMSLQIEVSLQTLANFLGVLNAQECKPNRIVLTSSRAVYGEGSARTQEGKVISNKSRELDSLKKGIWEPISKDEGAFIANCQDQQPNPVSVYGDMKLMQEMLLQKWCSAHDTKLDIFRLQNVVGPGQSTSNSYTGFLTGFVKLALAGGVINVFEGGGIVRDLIHVDDVASALLKSDRNLTGTQIYDIGSGKPLTIEAIAQKIGEHIDTSTYFVSNDFRLGDVRKAFADTSKAQSNLNWYPTKDLDVIISDVVEWVRKENVNA